MNRMERKREKGAVLVEVAFMLPILALIFLVVIDVALVVREHQVLQNAAREGARYSSLKQNWISLLNGSDTAAIRLRIQQVVVDYCAAENINISVSSVSVDQDHTIPLGDGMTARGSLVTVAYSRPMLILGRPLLPTGVMELRASSVFRNLY